MIRHRFGLRGRKASPSEDLSIDIETVKKGNVPRHVAIIMDGNGRWAKQRRQPRLMGHRAGAKTIRTVVETAAKLNIEYLTLYAFSTENWIRPKEEVAGLMQLFEEQINNELDELDAQGVRILTIGRLDEMPAGTRNAFKRAVERTKDNTKLNFVVAMNYSGRAEIVDAAKALCTDVRDGKLNPDIDEETFSQYLYTSNIPDPDLLIRTSGEQRVSNFLLWQIAYAEILITDKLWPDFTEADFIAAIADYQTRKRRFGGLDKD